MGADQEPGRRAAVEGEGRAATIPDAFDKSKKHVPTMLTTDLALRFDPAYEKISRRFHEHPDQFADAFARAWFKLTHRDMGPIARYLGPLVPKETLIWQDPIPAVESSADRRAGHRGAEGEDPRVRPVGVAAGLDRLGVGVDVPRLRQARRRQRRAHSPRAAEGLGGQPAGQLAKVLQKLEAIQNGVRQEEVSLADLIVLGGSAAVEKAAKDAGHDVKVPFTPGRMDASQEQTDVESFAPLEPRADGFRNYISGKQQFMPPEEALVDRAQLLTLTAPEMTVLVGGLRVLGANAGGSKHGVFTKRPGR
jgi:catalase-peroxidase